MKLNSLYIASFLGAKNINLDLSAPVNLICGGNFQGKSSIGDGVKFAMTGSLGRVALKKDVANLITDNQQAAVCEVATDGQTFTVGISRSGKVTDSNKSRDPDPRLPYVLDSQLLAKLPAEGRREFLAGLMGAKIDHAAVQRRLVEKGLDKARVSTVAPLLRVGFEAASTDAKRRATEAKGAWKAVTGETYGSQKAITWRADAPAFDQSSMDIAAAALAACDDELAQANQDSGALLADKRRADDARVTIASLRGTANMVQRCLDKLAVDEATLADVAARLEAAKSAAGTTPRAGMLHDLARGLHHALEALPTNLNEHIEAANRTLDAYEAIHGAPDVDVKSDPEAAASLPALVRSHETATSALAHTRRDLLAAENSAAEIKRLEDELESDPVDAEVLASAQDRIEGLAATRRRLADSAQAHRDAKTAFDAAEGKTAQAAKHHADVAGWDAIADALSPSGIQAELLAEALQPMNARLAQAAADVQWPIVVIGGDASITCGGRAYALLSESEQWRVDAMLAEAVSHLSGLRLLLLDRMDVLEAGARLDLLAWLDMLAQADEVQTAIVIATMKAIPAGLPATTAGHWIEDGCCGVVQEEAQAA